MSTSLRINKVKNTYLPTNFNTMKKQNKSFADRARLLEKKYTKLSFDPIEQKEFEEEMTKLQQEQEAVRQMMGLNQQEQPMQQFAEGGKLTIDDFKATEIPFDMTKAWQTAGRIQGAEDYYDRFGKYREKAIEEPLSMDIVKSIGNNIENIGNTQNKSISAISDPVYINPVGQNNNTPGFLAKNKDMLPYAISGASNIASNLLMAAMAKKNQQRVNPVLATPERMNMEPQAEQFRKDANVSKNIGMKQARDLGMNAGATLANMGAIGSGIDRNLANTLTNLYGQQEQFNVGNANQFALQNQDASNRANMMNAQFGQQANQDRLGFIGGALGTIPGVMKDVRMDKADKEMRGIMDAYYKSSGGRNYLAVGSIFDTDFGKYVVKGHNPDGTPITEKVKK
jgi:hypothetical protein